jgi:hypothetical protein
MPNICVGLNLAQAKSLHPVHFPLLRHTALHAYSGPRQMCMQHGLFIRYCNAATVYMYVLYL